MKNTTFLDRRRFLNRFALSGAFFTTAGAFAEQLTLTPKQTPGPFFPSSLPLDTDNDLLILNDNFTPAEGQVTHLTGRVMDMKGNPLRNTVVELWQVDGHGVYMHPRGGDRNKLDKNFQGYGRFLTGSTGEYYFRTIKPVPYPGRAPHFHVAVKTKGRDKFTTQCYLKGDPRNERDFIFRALGSPKLKESVSVDFQKIPGTKTDEVSGRFDIVLGITPKG
ncbi:MAG: protocatechuate 3,4-dioxygenase [Opitutales bacterium]